MTTGNKHPAGGKGGAAVRPFTDQAFAAEAGRKGRAVRDARRAANARMPLTDDDILDMVARAFLVIRDGFRMGIAPPVALGKGEKAPAPGSAEEREQWRKEKRFDKFYFAKYRAAIDIVKHYVGPRVLMELIEAARAQADEERKSQA